MTTRGWRSAEVASMLSAGVISVLATSASYAAQFDPPALGHTWLVPAVDPSGHVDVTDMVVTTDDKVVVFDAVSTKLMTLDREGVLLAASPALGDSLEIVKLLAGPEGSLYQWNGRWGSTPARLFVYDREGALLAEWSAAAQDLTVGATGEVYRLVNDHVVVSTRDGDYLGQWDVPTDPMWGVPYPCEAIAAAPAGVCILSGNDSYVWRAWRYGPTGDLVDWFPQVFQGGVPFVSGRAGTLYLVETATPFVRAISQSLIPLTEWVIPFDYPWDFACLAEDSSGHVFVAERTDVASRVHVYEPIGPGVIVDANHSTAPYWVDGVQYLGNHRFDWMPGSVHTIAAQGETETSPGTREVFLSWSDAGAAQHDVTAPPYAIGLRAIFRTDHFVSTVVDSGGTSTASAWIADSTEITLSAHEALGYRFVKWGHPDSVGWKTGDLLTRVWTHAVVAPESWEASFVRNGLALSISASETDPWANTAPPANGPRQLFLFGACLDRGISALEADWSGSLQPFSFTARDGVLNLGEGSNLYCAISGCPIGAEVNFLIGSWWVMDNGGDFCLTPSAANNLLAVVDCPSQFPQAWTPTIVGFSSIGDPCVTGPLCGAEPDSSAPDPNGVPFVVSPSSAPSTLALSSRGNPFRASVEMALDLPKDGRAGLRVYDVAGRLVRTLLAGDVAAGRRVISWDGRDGKGSLAPSGIYFVRLDAVGETRVLKLVRVPR